MSKKENEPTPGNRPLDIKIKPKHIIQLGDLKGDFNSGCSVIDVGFPNVFYIEVKFLFPRNILLAFGFLSLHYRNSFFLFQGDKM